METVIQKILETISKKVGFKVTLSDQKVQKKTGTDQSGTAELLLYVGVKSEVWTFQVYVGWHQGDIQNVSAERINSAYG